MSAEVNPIATHHLPNFITPPGEPDGLLIFITVFLVATILGVGIFMLRIHTLPERMLHKSEKLQLEIVSVLGLLALLTHIHAFWVAGLLLAFIDIPDFSTPVRSIAKSLDRLARRHGTEESVPLESLPAPARHHAQPLPQPEG